MARVEAENRERTPTDRQRVRVRVLSMVVALALVVTAGVVLTRHQPAARSTQAFCTRLGGSAQLASVLASGDAAEIRAGVHRFDQAAQVAPASIEAPVSVLVAYADGLARAVASGASDPGATLRAAMARQQAQVPAVDAAGRQVDQFVSANCHVVLVPAATSTVAGGLTPTTTGG